MTPVLKTGRGADTTPHGFESRTLHLIVEHIEGTNNCIGVKEAK